ncbi:MAG: hypothetical protein JKY56_19600 [Kofleriaceae bacterium]|nr:hypothetical protein [Kofleriaceae bacterium]
MATCTDADGCSSLPGACLDVCGATQLTIGQSCNGCGVSQAIGLCTGGGIHECNEANHNQCQELACGGVPYICTLVAGDWAWRTTTACDDENDCTYSDTCGQGICTGTTVDCSDTECETRSCNGTPTCTVTVNNGISCEDGDLCTFGDTCDVNGSCAPGTTVTCNDSLCTTSVCNGTSTCSETITTSAPCDDGVLCTSGTTCTSAAACTGGLTLDCNAQDSTCLDFSCDGSPTCASQAVNIGNICDDGDADTDNDSCQLDGTCQGFTCPVILTSVFSDNFSSPSSSSWTNGTALVVNGSSWLATTIARHGVRINNGRLEITNVRSGSASHGQGYATVQTGGAGSQYAALYNSVLSSNIGSEVVWSLNMRRDDPDTTDGGFSCSSTSSQNRITVGLAYVLASTSSTGLDASTGSCGATATANGYAVIMGGSSGRVRLVRFTGGLRNGAITDIATSGGYDPDSFFSVRVSYNATNNQWRLEARDDGSSFASPAAGSFDSTTTGTDTTYVATPLNYSGPYFQSGCSGLCNETYTARFDNLEVGLRCAP